MSESDPTLPESLDLGPEDFKDPVFAEGHYEAEISRCEFGRNKPDAKFAPNGRTVRIEYRLISDDPEVGGKPFRPMPMVVEPGQNFGFKNWLKGMGVDIDRQFTFVPTDWPGRKVTLRLSRKMIGGGDSRREANNLEEIRPND